MVSRPERLISETDTSSPRQHHAARAKTRQAGRAHRARALHGGQTAPTRAVGARELCTRLLELTRRGGEFGYAFRAQCACARACARTPQQSLLGARAAAAAPPGPCPARHPRSIRGKRARARRGGGISSAALGPRGASLCRPRRRGALTHLTCVRRVCRRRASSETQDGRDDAPGNAPARHRGAMPSARARAKLTTASAVCVCRWGKRSRRGARRGRVLRRRGWHVEEGDGCVGGIAHVVLTAPPRPPTPAAVVHWPESVGCAARRRS